MALGGPRVLFAGDQGTYGFSVTNKTNVDLPYVQFQYGVPQMDEPTEVYPRLQMTTNLAGQPQVDDVPWAALIAGRQYGRREPGPRLCGRPGHRRQHRVDLHRPDLPERAAAGS